MKRPIHWAALLLLLPTFTAASPLTERTTEEAEFWMGMFETQLEMHFEGAFNPLPYRFRVWLQHEGLNECTRSPRCKPQRLVIWLGSKEPGGRSEMYLTERAYAWEVINVKRGTTTEGDGQCITFTLRQYNWLAGRENDRSSFAQDQTHCLKAETAEERTRSGEADSLPIESGPSTPAPSSKGGRK
jgi:hypothetical protein